MWLLWSAGLSVARGFGRKSSHTSHATRHTSHATRHTPHATVACHSSSVTSASDSGPSGIFGSSTWRVCLSRFAVPKQYSKPLAILLMFTKSTKCLIIRLLAFFMKSLGILHLVSSNRVHNRYCSCPWSVSHRRNIHHHKFRVHMGRQL